MRIVAAALCGLFLLAAVAAAAPSGERMPNLSALHKLDDYVAADPCGLGMDMTIRRYNTPGFEDAPLYKATAVFNAKDRRPFVVSWAEDETDEASWPETGRLFYDFDRDGIVDQVTPRGDESLRDVVCAAAQQLR